MTKPSVKKFRAQYKTIGLTYSKCPLEREIVLEKLTEIVSVSGYSIKSYYVVQELHKDGTPHIHAWIELDNAPNIRSCRYFDIKIGDTVFHPNFGKYKRSWVFNYLKKFDKTPLDNFVAGFIELAKQGNYLEAVESFQQQEPRTYVTHMTVVNTNLRTLGRRNRPDRVFPPPIDGLPYPDGWDPTMTALLLCGDTGIGKTNWAKTWCAANDKTYLKVLGHIDYARHYNGEDVIIFDDVSLLHTPITNQIHACTVEEESAIHCRYSPAIIPRGVIIIFTFNPGNDPVRYNDNAAIARRCHFWDRGSQSLFMSPEAEPISEDDENLL